jgi:hypothetical protein
MTDIEIDKALALAIGWERQHFMPNTDAVFVLLYGSWRFFSHRDWNVIGPIMERYNASPMKSPKGTWSACVDEVWVDGINTPQKAIALAVIQGANKIVD